LKFRIFFKGNGAPAGLEPPGTMALRAWGELRMYLPTAVSDLLQQLRRRRVSPGLFDDLCVRCPKCGGRLILHQGKRGPEFFCLCPQPHRPSS
jgi:hypothetical protein